MPTSDKEIERKQDELEKLRSQIADLKATRESRERDAVNDITAVQLDTDIARLKLELDREKELAKPASVKAGIAAPLGNAQEAMAAAVATADAEKDATAANKKTTKEN